MRLLKKSEVIALKSKEKDIEIKQGVQLAKRVDALREVQAAEEASLEAFRRETIAAINKEIVAENAKLEAIRGEWAELRKKIDAGMSDVDIRIRDLEERESHAASLIEMYNQKLAQIHVNETLVHKKLSDASEEERRIAYDRQRINDALLEADRARKEAEQAQREASTLLLQTSEANTNATAQIQRQNEYLDRRMEVIVERERRLAEKESELTDRERLVEDRYTTLLQTETYGRTRSI